MDLWWDCDHYAGRLLMKWVDTYHCLSKVHCFACRSNPAWRKGHNAPKTCPYGVDIGEIPEPAAVALGEILSQFVQDRLAICRRCTSSCPLKELTKCQRTALLNRTNMCCPIDPPKWKPVLPEGD